MDRRFGLRLTAFQLFESEKPVQSRCLVSLGESLWAGDIHRLVNLPELSLCLPGDVNSASILMPMAGCTL